jgi:hypothetical protein
LPAATKARYRSALVKYVPGLVLPGAEEERSNPVAADEAYRSAVEWLKERCRGKDFPLVFKENIEYGFRRNMRGIRPFAIAAVALAAVGGLDAIVYRLIEVGGLSVSMVMQQAPLGVIGATVLLLIALLCWTFLVTDLWVREAGDQYARALLSACDVL